MLYGCGESDLSSSLAFGCPSAPLAYTFPKNWIGEAFWFTAHLTATLTVKKEAEPTCNFASKNQPVSSEASAQPRALHPGTTASCRSDAGPTTFPLYLLLPSTQILTQTRSHTGPPVRCPTCPFDTRPMNLDTQEITEAPVGERPEKLWSHS